MLTEILTASPYSFLPDWYVYEYLLTHENLTTLRNLKKRIGKF